MTSTELSFEGQSVIHKRLRLFRWTIPLSFSLVSIIYQFIVAIWVHDTFGNITHLVTEILFYGTVGPLAAFWVIQRISGWLEEKEKAEMQARRSERHLASLTAASADAIVSLDPTGTIESWNDGAKLIFGYDAEEMLGQQLQDLFGYSGASLVEYDWLIEHVQKNGFLRNFQTTIPGKLGNQIVAELTITHLRTDLSESRGYSVILRDITKRKEREEEIRGLNENLNKQVEKRTQELAEKINELDQANQELQKLDQTRSEFISLVSHQVRAPLTNIQGAVERMQADCGAINSTCGRIFIIIEQQISRLEHLVQDVLNVAQIESGEIGINAEPISILPTIQQVVEQFRARSSERTIKIPEKPGIPLVLADPLRISEVLVNLLDNADKYTQPGEEIAIEVRADQTEVSVIVRDFGPGILPEDIEHLFDKFYRTDSSDSQAAYGYGLGLFVSRNLVEAQGGRIWAENHRDGGAIFTFTLPVWQG